MSRRPGHLRRLALRVLAVVALVAGGVAVAAAPSVAASDTTMHSDGITWG